MKSRKSAPAAAPAPSLLPEAVAAMSTMQALADDLYRHLTEVSERRKARTAAASEVEEG